MSMPGLPLDYEPLTAKHKLPEAMAHGAPEVQTDILDRRRVRIVPQNGSAFGSAAGTQINILYSGNDMVDPGSMCLNATFTWGYTAANAGDWAVPDDGMLLSQISRARMYVAGVLVEDIAFTSRKVLSEVYSSCPESVYKTTGSAVWGAYKFVPELYANVAAGPTTLLKNQPGARLAMVSSQNATAAGGATGAGAVSFSRDLSIPLSLIFGLCRVKKYLPLRNMGQIQITLDLESNVTNTFSKSAGASGLYYSLANTELNVDSLAPSQTYAMFIDSFCASPVGLSIPFETCQSLLTNYSGAGQKSLVFSKQVKSLSHLLVARQQIAAGANFPVSTFNKLGIDFSRPGNNAYTQIGGARFPQDPKSAGPLFLLTLDAHHLADAPFSTVMDVENFTSPGDAANFGGHAYDNTCECQVLGFSYEKTRGEDLMSVGLNTGSQNIQLYINDAPAAGQVNAYGFVYFHQLLKIAGNMVKIEDSITA